MPSTLSPQVANQDNTKPQWAILIFKSSYDQDSFAKTFTGGDLSNDGITVKGRPLRTGPVPREPKSHNAVDNRSYHRREHEQSSRARDESRGARGRDDRREDRHDGVREPHRHRTEVKLEVSPRRCPSPRPRDESYDQRSSSSWGLTHQPTMQPTPIAPPYVQPLPIPARPPNQRVARGLACGAQG